MKFELVTYQEHNQEVCDFFISALHPFNGLIGQHTEENEPESHGITLNNNVYGVLFQYMQLKARNK